MLQAKIPQLGDLVADVWVDERHRRELEATQNPVEFGSPITDHAFVKARKLSVTFAVSNTPLVDNPTFSDTDRVEEARQKLYQLQDSRTLLTVKTITGGEYNNCLLTGIGWTTDVKNPYAVQFDLDLEEILIVTTEQTEYKAQPPDPSTKKKTEPTKKCGEKPKKKLDTKTGKKRTSTRDVSVTSKEQAKAAAAESQKRSIKKR